MKYWHWVGLVAVAAAALSIAACGSDDSGDPVSQAELNAAVREAERDARREAETQTKLDQLKEKINDLEQDDGSPSGSASSSSAPSSSTGRTPVSSEVGTTAYVNESAGWTADVPAGGGWSDGVETQVNDGLMRTTFDGPGDSMLTIDSTPYEAPAFGGAPIDSRTTVSHPVFGSAEKIVFQGNSNFEMCDRGLCVDFLMNHGSGGFAVLAGGPSNFAQTEAMAYVVMQTLRPN